MMEKEKQLVKIEHLYKEFDSDTKVLKDINLTINKNEVICTSQQKLDTNFKYYLSINLISVQYGASFATFLSG